MESDWGKIMNKIKLDEKQTTYNKLPNLFSKGKLLIVDDDDQIRKLLLRILEPEGYPCLSAANAFEASEIIRNERIDLIISDIMMPGKSGIQLLKEIRNEHPNIATLMVSGQGNQNIANKVISMGAYDYLYKPFQKKQVLVSVSNALRRKALDIQNTFQIEHLEKIIKSQTIDVSVANHKLNKAIASIVNAMSLAIESRDPYTAGHQNRVASIAGAIAEKMRFSKERIYYLRMAGIVHDIGKISVPAEILNKPGKLTDAEFNIIKDHPTTGYNILKGIDFHSPLAEIVYQHHERIDGSGYPRRLKGNEIHVEAKIIAVADVVEAMASHRPYRPALGIDIALDEIVKNRGRGFDPEIVDACCSLFKNNEFRLKL